MPPQHVESTETSQQVENLLSQKERRVERNGQRGLGFVDVDLRCQVSQRFSELLRVGHAVLGADVDVAGAQHRAVRPCGDTADHDVGNLVTVQGVEDGPGNEALGAFIH